MMSAMLGFISVLNVGFNFEFSSHLSCDCKFSKVYNNLYYPMAFFRLASKSFW